VTRPTKEAWAKARLEYETNPVATCESIGRELGVTKQAVALRKKNEDWQRESSLVTPELVEARDIVTCADKDTLSKRTPENISKLINALALTRSQEVACGLVGITSETFRNWQKSDPNLLALVRAKRSEQLTRCADTVYRFANKDPRLALTLLERAPETKSSFTDVESKGPEIHLHIHRDSVVIEGEGEEI
jgi:hypothetical protein